METRFPASSNVAFVVNDAGVAPILSLWSTDLFERLAVCGVSSLISSIPGWKVVLDLALPKEGANLDLAEFSF